MSEARPIFFDFDVTKMMADFRFRPFDVEALMASQRRNIEALSQANQLAVEGMQAVAKRQIEVARQAVEDMSALLRELAQPASPEDRIAKNTEFAKQMLEKSVNHGREITLLATKAGTEAADVLRNIPTGIVTVDPEGRLLYTNPAAEAILGFRERDWRDRPIMPEFARVAPEFWAALTATARRGVRAMRVEAVVRRSDRTFPIGVTTTTLDGAPGEGPRVTAIFSDISDSKRLERLRLRTERLEAVAELSSSLAHEIKNPLASIRSSVEQLARASRANPYEKFLTSLIVRESDRLSRLLSEFLDFSRVRVTECRPLDLHQVAGAAIRLVREHPDCPADARIELLGGRTPMEGDEDLLHRVVSNLVLNAVQAAGKEARVTVRTGRPEPHQLPGGAGIDNPVALGVSDNGPGIPESVRARLFEPFVTGRVGGTGLGLAIVQRAVDAHRGLVFVDSTPGQGTTFTVYFPAARRREEAA